MTQLVANVFIYKLLLILELYIIDTNRRVSDCSSVVQTEMTSNSKYDHICTKTPNFYLFGLEIPKNI